MTLYTIGHSNHKIECFIGLLKAHKISGLVDVRSVPYSRYNPQYNRENLQKEIIKNNINYIYMGDKLGGKPQNLSIDREYADFNFIFELIRKSKEFKEGICELISIPDNNKRVSIMCAEENFLNCHRYHLISKYFMQNYPETEILHIRGSSEIEKNIEKIPEKKKTKKTNMNQLSLFG